MSQQPDDRGTQQRDWLIAVVALLSIIIAFQSYQLWGTALQRLLGDAWQQFILPVLTNIVSVLVAAVFSYFLLRNIIAVRNDEDRRRLAVEILDKVLPMVETLTSSVQQSSLRQEEAIKTMEQTNRLVLRKMEDDKMELIRRGDNIVESIVQMRLSLERTFGGIEYISRYSERLTRVSDATSTTSKDINEPLENDFEQDNREKKVSTRR